MQTLKQIRIAQRKLANKAFASSGFTERGSVYVKSSEGVICGVNFQNHKDAGTFTINLGCSYSFINTCDSSKSDLDILDFPLRIRLGQLLRHSDHWYDFGSTEAECADRTTDLINAATAAVEKCFLDWKDPNWFMVNITPDVLLKNVADRVESAKKNDDLSAIAARAEAFAKTYGAIPGTFFRTWGKNIHDTIFFLAFCAVHLNKVAVALDYLRALEIYPTERKDHMDWIKRIKSASV